MKQPAGTETPLRHSLSSASEKGGTEVTRARLTFLLVNVALIAAWLGQFRVGGGRTFSDGD